MNDADPQGESLLRAQLGHARQKLHGLAQDLRAIDAELEDLATERQQHELLQQACAALEELGKLGAADLFWAGRLAGSESEAHLRVIRGRVDEFRGRLEQIERRRQAVVEQIDSQRGETELLEDDLYELKLQEEERKLEWIVEREISALPPRATIMPWSRGGEDDVRFRRALGRSLAVSLLLALLFPLIPLPLPEPFEPLEVPDRLTKLIREERRLPPPPPPRPQEVVPEPEAQPTKPAAEQSPTKSAASKGILAFREKFSSLADSRPAARLGAAARIRNAGGAPSGRPERSMVATQAPGSSGGINLSSLSRDIGGGGDGEIGGVQVARATSSIGGAAGSDRPRSDGPSLGRTDEEIQIVFDRHKSALYRLYNRELRRDPTLKGQMVLRIRIEPDGRVSLCELHSSDMSAPQLSAQVVERVKTFDFGAKDGIPAITILYPIDFLPAT